MKRILYLSHPHSKGSWIVGCFQRCENLFIVYAREIDFVQLWKHRNYKDRKKRRELRYILAQTIILQGKKWKRRKQKGITKSNSTRLQSPFYRITVKTLF